MEINKDNIKKEIERFQKKRKLLITLGIVLASLGLIGSFLTLYVVLYPANFADALVQTCNYLSILFSMLFDGGVVLIILGAAVYGTRIKLRRSIVESDSIPDKFTVSEFNEDGEKVVEIIETKPEEKPVNKYEAILKEYEKLRDQGLITNEEYEQKKKELM